MTCGFTAVTSQDSRASTQITTDQSTSGLDHLREALSDAYNRGDIEGMIRYLDPDVVIIFPDASVSKGRDGFRDYYYRMLHAPDHRVASFSAEPVTESRTVHNDVGLSYGYMNDKYVLTDGQSFSLNSRFTVTLLKSPDGPAETEGWMIRSFHSSADTFDNAILELAARRAFQRAGIGGLAVGTLLGLALSALLFRRRPEAGLNLPAGRNG